MAFEVYTAPSGEKLPYEQCAVGAGGVLTAWNGDRATIYGPAGWWRYEQIPDPSLPYRSSALTGRYDPKG
jgi:hypothetical protein